MDFVRILFLIAYLGSVCCEVPVKTTECVTFNNLTCKEANKEDCYKIHKCERDSDLLDKKNHCFVLWSYNSDNETVVTMKGCFLENAQCFNSECIANEKQATGLYFCCCNGDNCNTNFSYVPMAKQLPEVVVVKEPNSENTILVLAGSICGVVVLSGFIFAAYYLYIRKKREDFHPLPDSDPVPSLPDKKPLPIQLLEMKARGRFGAVYRAQYKFDVVAVKIFPVQDQRSWLTECEIYKLPHMNHENILYFIDAEEKCENKIAYEYWLITAYHDKGSLCDYLKTNVVTWPEMCHIAETMTRGLMHVHDEVPCSKAGGFKPAIAHRDFKSKNVLLKSDLTACIADFGLALIFHPGKPCGDTHGQVGTRRYMAPEVLEGAINFSRDSFIRIDMYACALVLWELASRCTAQEGPVPEYMLPFEEEVGHYPTLEDMQECVVTRKQRPVIPDTWRKHPGLSAFCNTMEECWDHDAEARLSASCVLERAMGQSCKLSASITSMRIGHLSFDSDTDFSI